MEAVRAYRQMRGEVPPEIKAQIGPFPEWATAIAVAPTLNMSVPDLIDHPDRDFYIDRALLWIQEENKRKEAEQKKAESKRKSGRR